MASAASAPSHAQSEHGPTRAVRGRATAVAGRGGNRRRRRGSGGQTEYKRTTTMKTQLIKPTSTRRRGAVPIAVSSMLVAFAPGAVLADTQAPPSPAADPPNRPGVVPASTPPASTGADVDDDAKSPGRALAYSIGGGLAGAAVGGGIALAIADAAGEPVAWSTFLLFGGIGPSLGHVYAGEYVRAAVVSGLRIGVAGVGVYYLDDDSKITLFGVVGALALTTYDFIDAPRAARRANRRARGRVSSMALVPARIKDGTGLSLVGQF